MQPIHAADLLLSKIEKDCKDDIALVVIMGSTLHGETHSRSDLDLYFVPTTERGKRLGFTFILDEIGYDLWPISWERLERIANHEERIASIITEGKVIYCASDEDRARFGALREKALDMSDQLKRLDQAEKKLNAAYRDYFLMQQADSLAQVRLSAVQLAYDLSDVLALLNSTIIKRGRGKLKDEIQQMTLIPERFAERYDTAFFSHDTANIRQSYGELLAETLSLLDQERARTSAATPFAAALTGFYEELINTYNKLYHAVDKADPYAALFACFDLTYEIEQIFAETGEPARELPDLAQAFDPGNLAELSRIGREHQRRFEQLLKDRGVTLRIFRDADELAAYLDAT